MSIIRNDTGGIRMIWRLILIILLYVAAAVLLRLIPISAYAAVLILDGMAPGIALEQAAPGILADPVWNTAIGVLSGLIGLLIAWFLLRVIEKSHFTWKSLGLDWRSNSLLIILLGALLAFLFFGASILIGYSLDSNGSSLNVFKAGASISIFLQNFVLYLALGFGEEVVFRGYVQTRLVERCGASWGILITAVVFVLLHQISYSLSPIIILSGVMLWTTIGALYYFSKSLYLVIIFHGVMNTLQNTLHFEIGEIRSMSVHALALILVVVFAFFKPRISGIRAKTV